MFLEFRSCTSTGHPEVSCCLLLCTLRRLWNLVLDEMKYLQRLQRMLFGGPTVRVLGGRWGVRYSASTLCNVPPMLELRGRVHSVLSLHIETLKVCPKNGVVRVQWPMDWLCPNLKFKPNMESSARETWRKPLDK
jgi:hypothetical protein